MDLMTRRGLIGSKAEPILPDGYIKLRKVSLTRAYPIRVGYMPSANTSVEVKYESKSTFASQHILSCSNFYAVTPRGLVNRCGNEKFFRELYGEVVEISCYRHENDIVINGELASPVLPSTTQPAGIFTLFSYNMYNVTYVFVGDFYYARIYDNDVLIRNYVPAKDTQGRVGVLELISKDFWYGTDANPAFTE